MIVKVQGQGGRAIRTAGSPIRLGGYAENDVENPAFAPGLNQHREAILSELMSPEGAYACATPGEPAPIRMETDGAPRAGAE